MRSATSLTRACAARNDTSNVHGNALEIFTKWEGKKVLRWALGMALIAALFFTQTALADPPPTPRPTRLPTPLPGGGMAPAWMTPPAPGPTQADAGALVYYERCMACHGDKGQGLSIEWRAQWDVAHQDCSKSACHGARHPPEGFSFPKNFAPALLGTGTLASYDTAQALFNFISTQMPYQAPGKLTQDEYWDLIAFLLRQRGLTVSQVNEGNASQVALHTVESPPPDAVALNVGIVAVVTVITGWVLWRMRRKSIKKPASK